MTHLRRALITGLLLGTLSACSSTPQANSSPCDMQQPAGSCAVRIEITRGRAVVCGAQIEAATPVCMNVGLDLTSAKDGYMSRKVLLEPGQCRTLGTALASAAQASCDAFAVRSSVAANQ